MQRLSSVVKEKVEAYVVSGVQEERKIELLDNLSIAVEKVQSKFENPIHNKVVKDGREVENLCSCLEDIFQHGLKEKIFHNTTKSTDNLSFWGVVQKLSMKEDIQSIYRLSIIQTDVNRCRAWIRMKLKDHTIGSYIGLLTENYKLLKDFYNSNAFLRDAVKTESVRTLLQYVIASLDFYINIESPRQNFDHIAVHPVASPVLSSPDIDVTHVDFQHGEIVRRRRSSKKRGRATSATIVPISQSDVASTFSSDHSSGRSSRGSSTASPITEPASENSEMKIKFLEGNSMFGDKPKSDMGHTTDQEEGKGSVVQSEEQLGIISRRTGSGFYRSGSTCSESSRSPCSNESAKYNDSSLFEDSLLPPKSHYNKRLLNEKTQTGNTESRIGEGESVSPKRASPKLRNVLTQEQKDEIVNMMTDLKLKSNRPLSAEKILDIIPIPEGMAMNEVKSYLSECLKDYFSLGIITTRSLGQNSVTSPSRKSVGKDLSVDSSCQIQNISSQSKAGNDLERKRSLDEFIKRGRTEPPYWGNMANDVKKSDFNARPTEKESSITTENESVKSVDQVVRDHCEAPENILVKDEKICGNLEAVVLKSDLNGEPAEPSSDVLEPKSDDRVDFRTEYAKGGLFQEKVNTESSFDAASKPAGRNVNEENFEPDSEKLIVEHMTDHPCEPLEPHMTLTGKAANESVVKIDSSEERSDCFVDETTCNRVMGRDQLLLLREEYDTSLCKVNEVKDITEDSTNDDLKDVILEDADIGERFEDASALEASNEINYVPGICEEISVSKHSEAKAITRLRKANTIGPGIARKTTSPRVKSTKSLERDAYAKSRSKNSSSGDNNELLYGFRVNSPSLANSTTSSIDTSQGYMFDDDDYVTDSETDTYTSGDNSEKDQIRSLLADLGVNDDIIGMKEDHFSTPESFMGFTTDEELENAIETCKERIKSLAMDSQERRHLVKKLVQLRLKRHEQKEAPAEEVVHVKKTLGHLFAKEGKVPGNYLCDSCGSTIWALLHTLYKCKDCSFHCHRKCLKSIDKSCVSKKISGSVYITDITPESGLATQQYRCADCRRRLTYRDGSFQTRLCNYTGQYYCSNCHWNEAHVVPARVVHNWDFSPKKISRQSKHLLNLLSSKPILCLKDLNPALFNFVEDLRDVRALREQILLMKKYLTSCRIAIEEKLLLMLKDRQHFVENSTMYTMQDLVSVNSGKLLEELSGLTATFGKHIKFDCPICQGRGFICEVCPSNDVIFPFDFNSTTCQDCHSLFHRSCYRKGNCPKCKRIEARNASKEVNDIR